jgi:hypothetical protein
MRFPYFAPSASSDVIAIDFGGLRQMWNGSKRLSLRFGDNLLDGGGDAVPLPLAFLRLCRNAAKDMSEEPEVDHI